MKKYFLFCILTFLIILSSCVTTLNLKQVEDKIFMLNEISFAIRGERFSSDEETKNTVKGLKIDNLVQKLNNELDKNGIKVEVNVENFKKDQKEGLKYLGKEKIGVSEEKMFEIPKWDYPEKKEQYIHLFIMQNPETGLVHVSFIFIKDDGKKKSDHGVDFKFDINEVF